MATPERWVLVDVDRNTLIGDSDFPTPTAAKEWLRQDGAAYRLALFHWYGRRVWPISTHHLTGNPTPPMETDRG